MPANAPPGSTGPAAQKAAKAKPQGKEVKILMLHGFTQSGELFNAKTKALTKLLTKALTPAPFNMSPTFLFPTGPFQLRHSDIPGFVPSEGAPVDEDVDAWSWFRRDEATGTYRGLDEGMKRVAETIREAGGVDGVIGFSQGGAMSSIVAAAMEIERTLPADCSTLAGVQALREANGNRPLKFSVIYSGFVARDPDLAWLFDPPIATPTLHVLGGLDTVVEESRSQGLIDRCTNPMKVVHPGGHYVPVGKEWTMPVVGFLRKCLEEKPVEEDSATEPKEAL